MTMWLVGMMGSGKTAAGRLAASRLGVEFSDTDVVVAERMGCSVAQLWGDVGEAAFRELEKVATALLDRRGGIVSTGGGVVLDPANREILGESGQVVWLRASPSVLSSRIGSNTGRPLMPETGRLEVLEALLEERSRFYEEVSAHQIDTDDMDVSEVANAIEAVWNQ